MKYPLSQHLQNTDVFEFLHLEDICERKSHQKQVYIFTLKILHTLGDIVSCPCQFRLLENMVLGCHGANSVYLHRKYYICIIVVKGFQRFHKTCYRRCFVAVNFAVHSYFTTNAVLCRSNQP